MRRVLSVWLFCALCLTITSATPQDSSSKGQATSAASAKPSAAKAASAASASEIAAAKASHKVWVNLDTGIYHKGGRWYGKTKDGKFMTEDEARKTGYKPAKRD